MRKNCPYWELFWSTFFPYFPESGLNLSIFSTKAGKCAKNADQNNSECGHFLRCGSLGFFFRHSLNIFSTNSKMYLTSCQTFMMNSFQKQSSRGVFIERCSKNMQQIYRRTTMSKCDFNKAV